jgi:hypothetical protein
MNSIIFLDWASALEFRGFESGATMCAFTLTIKPRGEQSPLVQWRRKQRNDIRRQLLALDTTYFGRKRRARRARGRV